MNPTYNYGGYTPELGSSYLASILNKSTQQNIDEVGKARREGVSGGIVSEASTGERVAGSAGNTNTAYLDSLGSFGINVAGQKYGDRMSEEGMSFQADEKQKSRDFETQVASLEMQFREGNASAERGYEHITEQQGLPFGIAGSMISGASRAAAMAMAG